MNPVVDAPWRPQLNVMPFRVMSIMPSARSASTRHPSISVNAVTRALPA